MQNIQVYEPTSLHDEEKIEEFHSDICNTTNKNKSHFKAVMRNFNTKTGQDHAIGERNKRGTRLVQWSDEQHQG